MTDNTSASANEVAKAPESVEVTEASVAKATPTTEKAAKVKKEPFCFTDPGCRTEVRLGALLTVGPIFLWMWLRPDVAVFFLIVGLPLLWAGIPFQAIQARKQGRPGYPWKLGIAFTLLGGLMIPDQVSRIIPGGEMHLQIQAPALCLSGIWILAWWFYARQVSVNIKNGEASHG